MEASVSTIGTSFSISASAAAAAVVMAVSDTAAFVGSDSDGGSKRRFLHADGMDASDMVLFRVYAAQRQYLSVLRCVVLYW